MSGDLISRQSVIEALNKLDVSDGVGISSIACDLQEEAIHNIENLPSAQPETNRIENALHGKSAEEQYDFLRWLMQDYGMQFTDTRVAVIEWLRGENDG